jgi:hypothetical protein
LIFGGARIEIPAQLESLPKPSPRQAKDQKIEIQTDPARNFCRIHQTLRVTPAMEAGVADHVWETAEVIAPLGQKGVEMAA